VSNMIYKNFVRSYYLLSQNKKDAYQCSGTVSFQIKRKNPIPVYGPHSINKQKNLGKSMISTIL
jgi:hypothetical protein